VLVWNPRQIYPIDTDDDTREEVGPVSPSSAHPDLEPDTFPGPPRQIPDDLVERHGRTARIRVGIGAAVLVFGALIGGAPVVYAIATGARDLMGAGLAIFVVVGGGGAWLASTGWSRRSLLRELYRRGEATAATITGYSRGGFESGEGASTLFTYEFEVDGRTYTGEVRTRAVTYGEARAGEVPSKRVTLYDPRAPERNVMLVEE
jgi:hypothetical protein